MKKQYLLIFIAILLLTGCKTKIYTVTFVNEDGTKLSNIDIKKGSNLENIENPSKEGYIFVTWLKNGIEYDLSKPITEDLTLTASWIETPKLVKQYTVTFNIDGEIKTKTIEENKQVEQPKEPKKEKYKFLGWYIGDTLYDFNTPVTKDLLIVAKFEKSRVIVNFDLDEGNGTTKKEIEKGSILKKPKDPEKYGYRFTGWTLNGNPYNFDTPVNEDITIKANYEAIEYVKVKFETNGGTPITPKLLQKGQILTNIQTPSKEGYTFKYWLHNEKEFNINTPIETSITLYAIYEENKPSETPPKEEQSE